MISRTCAAEKSLRHGQLDTAPVVGAATGDHDTYTIETLNDRGLWLTPADVLQGYLLANITDAERRMRASGAWKQGIHALAELGKGEDADGIKSWLRSQYAESIPSGRTANSRRPTLTRGRNSIGCSPSGSGIPIA